MQAHGPQHQKRRGYKSVGIWGWNDQRLWSKIEVSLDTEECWPWKGSMSPGGALMGAWKEGRGQMTQARRLVYMSQTNEDVSPYQVKMKCHRQDCLNPSHFEIKPNYRKVEL